MKDYTIFIDGISKAFAATGVRVGWALGPQHVLNKMRAINSHIGAWSPMAEQHATAKYLFYTSEVDNYFTHYKSEIEERLRKIYEGFLNLKLLGFCVDAIAPQASIYLTIQLNLTGKKTSDGILLNKQKDVTDYVLNEARIAVVPFYAFGASSDSNWYRLSVGTCKKEEIDEMFDTLKRALEKLS